MGSKKNQNKEAFMIMLLIDTENLCDHQLNYGNLAKNFTLSTFFYAFMDDKSMFYQNIKHNYSRIHENLKVNKKTKMRDNIKKQININFSSKLILR